MLPAPNDEGNTRTVIVAIATLIFHLFRHEMHAQHDEGYDDDQEDHQQQRFANVRIIQESCSVINRLAFGSICSP